MGQEIRNGREMESWGEEGEAGSHSMSGSLHDRSVLVLVASDLHSVGKLWKTGAFVKDLNTHTWLRGQICKGGKEKA